jgi:hypothetical protein
MADNLDYAPASGTTIQPVATDDVGGVHYQKIKLDGGADGQTLPITGTTDWGMTADVKKAQLLHGRLVALSGTVSLDKFIPLDIQWAAINATAASLSVIVSGAAGFKYRVLAVTLITDGAVSIRWKSGTSTTLIEQMAFAKNGGLDVNRGPHGWFVETNGGDHLSIDLSVAANVRGSINYIKIPT